MTHQQLVTALVKPGEQILAEVTPAQCNLLHMAIGVSGEAGELLDAVKRNVIYCKPLDRQNVVEELGDLEFYMEGLRQELKITRAETLLHNMVKLQVRYDEGKYSNTAANLRKDKQ